MGTGLAQPKQYSWKVMAQRTAGRLNNNSLICGKCMVSPAFRMNVIVFMLMVQNPGDLIFPGFYIPLQSGQKKPPEKRADVAPPGYSEIYDVLSSQHGTNFLKPRKIEEKTPTNSPTGGGGSPKKRGQRFFFPEQLVYEGITARAASSEIVFYSSDIFDHCT
jgi:hypothetical protein